MIVLYHAGGADDFELLAESPESDSFRILRQNVLRLLRARKRITAVSILEKLPFRIRSGTNHFQDEFSVLHASVELEQYERCRKGLDTLRVACKDIAAVFLELGVYIRFIAVDLELEKEQATCSLTRNGKLGWQLSRLEITKLVNRYIGVNGGYLGDFSYRSHLDFYVDLDLDINPYDYEGTTRERFIRILSESTPEVQARILEGVLERYPTGSSDIRTPERFDEIQSWIARLRETKPSKSTPTSGTPAESLQLNAVSASGPADERRSSFRFDFAISFAGSDRALARQLRDALRNAGFKVFFDEDFEHEMIGHDGSLYLRDVYSKKCRFCVVLISKAYDQREWTNLEREAVQSRELTGERGILLPVRIEDYQPAWLPATRIHFDLWKRSLAELVTLLTKRCTPA